VGVNRRQGIRYAAIGAAGLALAVQLAAAPGLDLPGALAGYRGWTPWLKTPHRIPHELAMRCAAPTPAEWAEAAKRHGPHTSREIQVYANAAAAAPRTGAVFSVGAIIAKEKFVRTPTPEGVGFMMKRAGPEFQDTGGWEFSYFPSRAADRRTIHEACAACHRSASRTDYVFGTYPID
jgi:Cytochrome P460